ncbi:GntR family transcriptional regulator [Phenylobacterium sp. LjRoot219]|uniref:GntR family transcriptional regulator n=1 Tax=Phenylobacterium sp. LjRoot219 TaxID=3342283 RepID=UPI003ECD5691
MPTAVEKVVLRLRSMILNGEFAPGERILEKAIAERLGVSRTPVRWALPALESEGLVQGSPNRGFRVRSFAIKDVLSAYEVRGTLEGLACRLAAENGVSPEVWLELDDCLREGDDLVRVSELDESAMRRWSELNERFHRALLTAANNVALELAIDAVTRIPATSPGALLFSDTNLRAALAAMRSAHAEHKVIVEALRLRQAQRAEYLIREHVYNSSVNVRIELEREREQQAVARGRPHEAVPIEQS